MNAVFVIIDTLRQDYVDNILGEEQKKHLPFPKMHDYMRKLEAFRTIKICVKEEDIKLHLI